MKSSPIISGVVDAGLCCGCGICAAACPRDHLAMGMNSVGELNPGAVATCPDGCSICSAVCPYVPDAETSGVLAETVFGSVPGIQRTREMGHYLGCFAGYSAEAGHRANGASGGMLTWTLETLLREKRIDGALCVEPASGPEQPLFRFAVCRTAEEIRRCSRSAYYPVEPGTILREILKLSEGRYAVTALPCVCKALRRAQKFLPKFRERIAYMLGLTCGKGNSAFHVEAICAATGGNPKGLESATFRVKSAGHAVANFATRIVSRQAAGTIVDQTVHWHEPGGQGTWWGPRYFTPLACDLCDDLFAECADAVFMDAWLPEYPDRQGTSLVVARSSEIQSLLAGADPAQCALAPIDARRVARSQRTAMISKRGALPARARQAERSGVRPPPLRLELCRGYYQAGSERLAIAQWRLARESGKRWAETGGNLPRFRDAMRKWADEAATAKRHCERFRWLTLLMHPARWMEPVGRIWNWSDSR